jgi:multiple sugar transport system ATP-binding protein
VIEDKEFLVLVGPSGSGKTTILRMIAGLEEVTQGIVSIDGQAVNHLLPADRDVAMVFQHYALYPHMTVYENMALGLKLRRCPRAEIEQRVRESAEILGLLPYLSRRPAELSGGQRQRVSLGRAIVRKPKVFLFDEPLSHLDANMRVQMRAEIAKLHKSLDSTVIYVTHDQLEAMTMGDRIGVLRDGTIQQAAAPLDLYDAPINLFVAGFIGFPPMNFLNGTIISRKDALYFQIKQMPLPSAADNLVLRLNERANLKLRTHAGQPIVLGLRPEDIKEKRTGDNRFSETLVAASVDRVEHLGPETHLHLNSSGHSLVARSHSFQSKTNEKATFWFDMDKAHFFDPLTERSVL